MKGSRRITPRRRMAVRSAIVAGLVVLAACGGSETTHSSSGASAPEEATVTTEGGAADATISSGDVASGSDNPDGSTRIVVTDLGEYEVPSAPTRIVVTDPVLALPTALDLGVPIAGTMFAADGTSANELITDTELAGVESIGDFGSPLNLESIAAVQPDLIVAAPQSEEEFALISEIAPAVPQVPTASWRDDVREIAAAFGELDEIDLQLAEYDARAAELAQRIDDELGDPTVIVLRVRPDAIRVHTNLHFAGNLLGDAGLRIPDEWQREPADDTIASLQDRVIQISPELIGELQADHIILLLHGRVADSPEAVQAAFDEIAASPLWATLPAVQAGNVYPVRRYWLAGARRAALAALDDIETFLLDSDGG